MVCIYCGGPTAVTNSRPQKKNNQVWRRRHCAKCGATFSTREAAQYALAWQVRHGKRLEPFSGLKLLLSLHKSCEHRPTALSDAEGLTDTIIGRLPAFTRDGALDSQDIAQVALVALNRFDKAAALRYQAFHQ
jgi:transcriptional repressor NrdR